MRTSGNGLKRVPNRFLYTAALVPLTSLSLVACVPAPTRPDAATRDTFARTVVAAAASGSVERVEMLVPKVYSNVRPDAQRLVDSTRGWDPATVELKVRSDFPELAQVQALIPGAPTGTKFTVAWGADGHWALVLGTSSYKPTGNAAPGTPGIGTPKVIDPSR
jgi:hypothetical protein